MTINHHDVPRVPATETYIDDDLIYYYGDERFTGVRYRTYPDGTLSYEESFVNGYPEGYERRWYRNGQMKLEIQKSLGCFENGDYREWYESGLPKLFRRKKNNILLESTEWNEEGRVTLHWHASSEPPQIPK